MNKKHIVVTGMGAITSNGSNVNEFFQNSMAGQRGITDSPCPVFDTGSLLTQYWGTADAFLEGLQDSPRIYRSERLAKHAITEALADAHITKQNLHDAGTRCALILASLSYDDYYILETSNLDGNAKEIQKTSYLSNLSGFAQNIKNYCGVTGACYDFSSACSSSTAAIGFARDLIQSEQYDIAIVCGADSLSQMVAYGFHSLKALSSHLCHPLDSSRDGINIGEGCGVLVMESDLHAQKRRAKAYAECVGASTGNEAFHITSPDTNAEGFFRSMKTALDDAGLSPESIDYVNLHGTGTPINDSVELAALKRLYGTAARHPYLSSLKSLIGHCMGAAGALEAIMTVLCLNRQQYLPISYVVTPMEELKEFTIQPMEQKHTIRYAMSNSFAFAGNTASVIFQRIEDKIPEPDTTHAGKSQQTERPVWINGIGILTPQMPDVSQWIQILYDKLSVPKMPQPIPTPTPGIPAGKLRGVNHLSRLLLSSALQAECDGGLHHDSWVPEQIGTYYSSGFGAVTERLEYGKIVSQETPDLCSPTVFANISPNAPLGHLCINLHCKGPSASFHGASPLLPSLLSIQKGNCSTVFSSMTEEYELLIEKTSGNKYQESSITLLLQDQPTEHSYCAAEQIVTFDSDSLEAFMPVCTVPDLIFADRETACKKELQKILRKYYKNIPLLFTDSCTGPLAGNILYANIALAAVCLKRQSLPDCLTTENVPAKPFSSILVTGSDSCKNFHQVLLTSVSKGDRE